MLEGWLKDGLAEKLCYLILFYFIRFKISESFERTAMAVVDIHILQKIKLSV